MRRRWLAFVMLATACEAPADPDAPIPFDMLCEVAIGDLCRALVECGESGYRDSDHCRADHACLGESDLARAIENGWASYDEAAAGECHARFVAAPCDFGRLSVPRSLHGLASLCPGMIEGLQMLGEPCGHDTDCRDGFCAVDTVCPGVCTAFVPAGGACSLVPPRLCEPELTCRDSVCRAPPSPGDPCDQESDCGLSSWCDRVDGTCRELAGAGSACDEDAGGARCDEGLVCVEALAQSGTCASPGERGEPCGGSSDCVDALRCEQADPLALGTCADRIALGGACGSVRDCEEALACVDDVCSPRSAAGEPCSASALCQETLLCVGGTCLPPAYPGDACVTGQCSGSSCDAGICRTRSSIGAACITALSCASNACEGGVCIDPSACL